MTGSNGSSVCTRIKMLGCVLSLFLIGVGSQASGMSPDSLAGQTPSVPWSFLAAGYYYTFPDDDDIFMMVGRADRGSLHLEARYNYEDLRTGSLFAGWTISSGESFTIELTPMMGAAFGQTRGVIPAVEISLGYGMLDVYDESEYLFDLGDKGSSFFYSWLELGVTPGDLFRIGLVAQRTRLIQTPLELERGLFLQVTPEPGSAAVYAFNLFTENWFVVVGVEIAW